MKLSLKFKFFLLCSLCGYSFGRPQNLGDQMNNGELVEFPEMTTVSDVLNSPNSEVKDQEVAVRGGRIRGSNADTQINAIQSNNGEEYNPIQGVRRPVVDSRPEVVEIDSPQEAEVDQALNGVENTGVNQPLVQQIDQDEDLNDSNNKPMNVRII